MTWALVNPNRRSQIFKTAKNKYDLLKWGVELKTPVSKKTIKNYKEGDLVTVIFRKTFEKWFTDPKTRRYYKDTVTEESEKQYLLVRIVPVTESNQWKDAVELVKAENKQLKKELDSYEAALLQFIEQTKDTTNEELQQTIAEAKKLLEGKQK